jgi:biopolymer transport protein ExbD
VTYYGNISAPHGVFPKQETMRPNQQRSEGLICSIDVSAFAAIMMVLVVTFMMMIPSGHGGVSADLPKVSHPMPMRKARREDAMTAAVMRTGDVFFGSNLEMKRCNSRSVARPDPRLPWERHGKQDLHQG